MGADNTAWYEVLALEEEDNDVYYLAQGNEEEYVELSFD